MYRSACVLLFCFFIFVESSAKTIKELGLGTSSSPTIYESVDEKTGDHALSIEIPEVLFFSKYSSDVANIVIQCQSPGSMWFGLRYPLLDVEKEYGDVIEIFVSVDNSSHTNRAWESSVAFAKQDERVVRYLMGETDRLIDMALSQNIMAMEIKLTPEVETICSQWNNPCRRTTTGTLLFDLAASRPKLKTFEEKCNAMPNSKAAQELSDLWDRYDEEEQSN